ncbi:MAG TPA: NAD(P)/FAD-dependent oxidoreductase [Bacteriovoracaceae bacterium]|nr:NAD(P)/FAD-dependent oxidoreductase [Bacteriovoracaceae bacterium]
MQNKIYPVCVIGGGSAGTMAVLRTILNNDECLFFPGSARDKKRSRALWVRKVENIPAHFNYKRGIEEPNAETLKLISESAFASNLTTQKNTGVVKLQNNADGLFEITDSRGNLYHAQYIILCTGVMDIQPEIQGSIETIYDYANAQTIDYCLICDGHHVLDKKTAVIGHTNTAAWICIMLFERYGSSPFYLLTNGRAPEILPETQKILDAYKIKILTSAIKEINGEDKGKVLQGFNLEDGLKVDVDICFVSLGMLVYNELALQVGAEVDERGFVKAPESGETSVERLFVAGDLKANTKKQIYTSWDTAVNAANTINQKLRTERRKKITSVT